MTCRRCT